LVESTSNTKGTGDRMERDERLGRGEARREARNRRKGLEGWTLEEGERTSREVREDSRGES